MTQDAATSLAEIDRVRKRLRRPTSLLVAQMKIVPAYAHQSVMIENNTLPPGTSLDMFKELQEGLFTQVDLPSLSIHDLAKKTPMPRLVSFVPKSERDVAESIELRNHIVASQWIAQTAPMHQGEDGMNEDQVRALSALTMKDLDESGRGFYPWAFGPRIPRGQYRQTPIGVRSNPLAVFPYHLEVPACLRRYFAWRTRAHAEQKLHPLLLACHSMVYFLQIHPFIDGNGRISRMMMQDYLMRQGYLPSYLLNLDREEYLRMIRCAADGDPTLLVDRVLTAQLEFLSSFMLEEAAEGLPETKRWE